MKTINCEGLKCFKEIKTVSGEPHEVSCLPCFSAKVPSNLRMIQLSIKKS